MPEATSDRREHTRRHALQIGVALVALALEALLLRALLTPAATTASNPASAPGPPTPQVGQYAPDAHLFDLSGRRLDLMSLRGKVVILNFWYAACEPCRYEMPALQRAYDANYAAGLEIVGADAVADVQTMRSLVDLIGITYPVYRDPNQGALSAYQVTRTPTSFFISRQGVIRNIVIGPVDTSQLQQDVARLLAAP